MPDSRGKLKSQLGASEFSRAGDLGKALVAEALGTLFITYFGCMSCTNTAKSLESEPADLVLISLTFGFVVAVSVQALGHVSGANLNPAVTCGLLITGKITIIRGLLYILSQSIGAIIGAAMLNGLTPEKFRGGLGLTSLRDGVSIQQGIGVEFMLGFLLVLVVFGVIDPNKPDAKIPAAIAIGLAVAVGHLSSVNYTGSSMNPARSLGAAAISGNWDNHWIYWLGPILGGIVAAVLYSTVFAAPPQRQFTPLATDQELKSLGKDVEGHV